MTHASQFVNVSQKGQNLQLLLLPLIFMFHWPACFAAGKNGGLGPSSKLYPRTTWDLLPVATRAPIVALIRGQNWLLKQRCENRPRETPRPHTPKSASRQLVRLVQLQPPLGSFVSSPSEPAAALVAQSAVIRPMRFRCTRHIPLEQVSSPCMQRKDNPQLDTKFNDTLTGMFHLQACSPCAIPREPLPLSRLVAASQGIRYLGGKKSAGQFPFISFSSPIVVCSLRQV